MIFGVDGDFRLRNFASCQSKKAIWLSTTSGFMGEDLHKVGLKVLGGNQLDSRIIELVKE